MKYKQSDFLGFPGGWSISTSAIYLALNSVEYANGLNILEFGSGEGTTQLVGFLDSNGIKYNYVSYEDNETYSKTAGVSYVIYDKSNIDSVEIDNNYQFDLVIVDGPHGVERHKWYHKISKNVKPGTVVLIDDYHHYSEFGQSLDNHYSWSLVSEYDSWRYNPPLISGQEFIPEHSDSGKCWKIVKLTEIKDALVLQSL